jgi:ATP-dependent DNA helicase RecQ
VDFLLGKTSKEMKDFRYTEHKLFGKGADKDELYWHSVTRQAILNDLLYKDIELYGILKLTVRGKAFIKEPHSIPISINNDYSGTEDGNGEDIELGGQQGGGAMDEKLLSMLKEIRHEEAKKMDVKPWVIFSDPSLRDMTIFYPITMEDMLKISGVSKGKAEKYAQPFLNFIRKYVEENDIERPADFLIRQVANKSRSKVSIIQNIDRKVPFEDIAANLDMTYGELLDEMYAIVSSGTKLNVDYYINEKIDEFSREDIYDYFMEADSDDLEDAFRALAEEDDEITHEEIQLVRIKFISDIAN